MNEKTAVKKRRYDIRYDTDTDNISIADIIDDTDIIDPSLGLHLNFKLNGRGTYT